MNNSQFIQHAFNEQEEPDLTPVLEQKKTETEKMLVALRFLKGNDYFQHYKEVICNSRVNEAMESLKNEKDSIMVARLQGFITSTEALFDLAKLEQFYQAQFESIKGRLEKEQEKNNAKNKK